jgi:hypothetical protein
MPELAIKEGDVVLVVSPGSSYDGRIGVARTMYMALGSTSFDVEIKNWDPASGYSTHKVHFGMRELRKLRAEDEIETRTLMIMSEPGEWTRKKIVSVDGGDLVRTLYLDESGWVDCTLRTFRLPREEEHTAEPAPGPKAVLVEEDPRARALWSDAEYVARYYGFGSIDDFERAARERRQG